MSFRQTAGELEKFFLEQMEPIEEAKLSGLDKLLHHGATGRRVRKNSQGLDKWSKKHKDEVEHVGSLPNWPSVFPDQRIAKASRGITRAAIFLPQTTYFKASKGLFDRVVGSEEMADSIIESYDTTPAHEEPGLEDYSLTDYAIRLLEEGASFGISSGHVDKLSDIGEFTAGLSLAVGNRKGKKYLNNFKVLVNKNMTRETYMNIPIAWLMSWGVVPYWGLPPGDSMDEHGIPEEAEEAVNKMLVDKYRSDRKLGSVVLGFVPSGSRMVPVYNQDTQELERLDFKKCYTGSFMTRCDGGIIPANRFGDKFEIGSVIPAIVDGKSVQKNILSDRVMETQAHQIARLSGLTVSYEATSGPQEGETILIKAA